ncbi:MAG: DUF2789 domain-containing protein [Gammaproteobacteria bacterium]|nr:DUF2789 domain-containing protein [Gammaproteobacteria bacterium]
MEYSFHSFSELFKQLGLGSNNQEIEDFLREHAPLPIGVLLSDAPFWSPAQAAFLREAREADSDWSEVVDALNVALRTVDKSE